MNQDGDQESSIAPGPEDEGGPVNADWQRVSEYQRRVAEAVRSANLSSLLEVLTEDIVDWATHLKRYMFQLFEGYEGKRLLSPHAGFAPIWLGRPIVGANEAFDLLEFHKSPEHAKAYARRIDELLKARRDFLLFATSFEGTSDSRGYGEFQASVDGLRHDLKYHALSVAEYVDLVRSQIAPGRPPKLGTKTTSRPGRRKLSGKEEKRRHSILRRWEEAREAGISRSQFCQDESIEVKDLENYQNWANKREERASSSDKPDK